MWAGCWPVQRQNVHGWAREWTDCVMQVRSRTAYWTRHAGPGPHKYTLATLAQIGIRPGSSARPPGKLEKLRCLSSHLIRQSFNSNGGCSYIKIICLETNLSNLYITSYMVSKIWSLYRMSTNHSFAALQSISMQISEVGTPSTLLHETWKAVRHKDLPSRASSALRPGCNPDSDSIRGRNCVETKKKYLTLFKLWLALYHLFLFLWWNRFQIIDISEGLLFNQWVLIKIVECLMDKSIQYRYCIQGSVWCIMPRESPCWIK